MEVFNTESFRRFLGAPVYRQQHEWGLEERYVVSEAPLAEYRSLLRDTLYYHHSSFDLSDDIADLGHPLVARAMRERSSGNPTDPKTQMGNLGEVVGVEFARAFLGFETSFVHPKRWNTNPEQSMKGVDIVGLRDSAQPAQLLLGEAKANDDFDSRSVQEAYDQLAVLEDREASRLLHCQREILRLRGERRPLENVDRHMARGVPRQYLLLLLTGSRPRDPFATASAKFVQFPLLQLRAVHIQVGGLNESLPRLFAP